jgi:hypothetical protein
VVGLGRLMEQLTDFGGALIILTASLDRRSRCPTRSSLLAAAPRRNGPVSHIGATAGRIIVDNHGHQRCLVQQINAR